jgi:8-oxo-dGTP diphosphatase
MNNEKRVGVGVGIYLVHFKPRENYVLGLDGGKEHSRYEQLILMGKRKGSHGAGTWSVPGGHVEYGDSALETCYRELEEETGLARDMVADLFPVTFVESVFEKEEKHYITLVFHGLIKPGIELPSLAQMLKEPEKCSEWRWFNKDTLPPAEELFLPVQNLMEAGYDIFSGSNLV